MVCVATVKRLHLDLLASSSLRRAVGLLLLLVLLGCAPAATSPTVTASTPPLGDDRAPLEWARTEPYTVVVRRSCRTLSVYRYGDWVRTYHHVSFGRVPGVKLYEGDRRTPNGLYRIVGRREHPRWSRFLLIDYPNLSDMDDHRRALEEGTALGGPGGEIGIHGTDKPEFNKLGIDWTFGCIALMNEDVEELYELVPDGSLVLIED